MKLRQVLRKTVTLATLGCFAALPSIQAQASDLQGEIDSMFTNLGAIGNYTQPGAFRGQVTILNDALKLGTPAPAHFCACL